MIGTVAGRGISVRYKGNLETSLICKPKLVYIIVSINIRGGISSESYGRGCDVETQVILTEGSRENA
jgi:hypothetical protein